MGINRYLCALLTHIMIRSLFEDPQITRIGPDTGCHPPESRLILVHHLLLRVDAQ
jgi:hypothetical protein